MIEDTRLDKLLRSVESMDTVTTESVDINLREIRALLRVDGEFFIEFFLAEQLDMPVPQFHTEIWSLLTDEEKERVLLAIPRDHAKTTLAKLVVIWYWLYTNHRFAVYLSNTNPIAKGACKDIIGFLYNPNFVAVFGKIDMVKSSENESLWIFNLTMPNGRVKKCILRAIGQGQQMRGINIDNQRPDIAIVDDVEDNDNTASEFQQKKLDEWMFGPFIKALAQNHKILWLGNMLSKTSLLARLSRKPLWNPVVFGALVKDTESGQMQPLWPGRWTVEKLTANLQEYRDLGLVETWMCEMMNMPGHGENGFTVDQINYQPIPNPDECVAAFITIDPAFGLKAHNDETAISVHVILENRAPMTVCVVHGKGDEHWMFLETIRLAQYWNAWVWGIEAVAAQKVLISFFGLLLAGRQMLGMVEMIPLLAGKGDPKTSRIRSCVALMANEEWAIPEGDIDITQQILEYDTKRQDNSDDIIDSVAYGPIMMDLYHNLIMSMAAGDRSLYDSKPIYGTEVCGV